MDARAVPLVRELLVWGLWALTLGALGAAASLTVEHGFIVYAAAAATAVYMLKRAERPSLYADVPPSPLVLEAFPRTVLRAVVASLWIECLAVAGLLVSGWSVLTIVLGGVGLGVAIQHLLRAFEAFRKGRAERCEFLLDTPPPGTWMRPRKQSRRHYRRQLDGAQPAIDQDTLCLVCGRDVDPAHSDSRRVGAKWFCSPAHVRAHEAQLQQRYAPRSRGILALLVLFLVVSAALAYSHRPGTLSRDPFAALQQAAAKMANPGPPIRVTAPLDQKAFAVADAFVRARYVDLDCGAASKLMADSASKLTVRTFVPEFCEDTLKDTLKYNDHLIAGSRSLKHDCKSGFLGPPTIVADDCVGYVVVGRNLLVSSVDNKPVPGCDEDTIEVFLVPSHSGWAVLDQDSGTSSGGGCDADELRLWKRRIPYDRT